MSSTYSTLLAQLAAERHWTYDDGVKQFARTAAEPAVGLRLTVSPTQWRRWLGGGSSLPRPANARVLERMFGRPVEELFALPVRSAVPVGAGDDSENPLSMVEETVMDSARNSAQFLARAEQANVGPLTIEQFHSDVRRLANQYPHRAVFPSFVDITELRDRAFEMLEGRQPPDLAREPYYVSGQICAMLSMASLDLGWPEAAETQARTAWLCADLSGSNWLRAWVRGMQARIAYWDDRPADAARLAEAGREYVPDSGTALVQLGVVEARAFGKLHDGRGVDEALARAEGAREAVSGPDDPGGCSVSLKPGSCTMPPLHASGSVATIRGRQPTPSEPSNCTSWIHPRSVGSVRSPLLGSTSPPPVSGCEISTAPASRSVR